MCTAVGKMGNAIVTTAALIAVFGLTLFAFWGVLRAPFHFDDSLVLESPQVADPGDLSHLIRPAQTRQLTYLTFYLNYRLGGANPTGYHVVSLLLHLANIFLVLVFARLLIKQETGALRTALPRLLPIAAAGIFALHPIQSEAVNYAYQRGTLLAAFFSLLALSTYLRSQTSVNRIAYRLLTLLFWLMAAASKESAWILPLIPIAYLWANARDFGSFRASLRQSSWFIATITMLMLSGIGWICYNLRVSGDHTVGSFPSGNSLHYLTSQVQVFATYLRLLIWPAGLSIDHDFKVSSPWSPYGLYCLLLLLGLLTLIIQIRRSRPLASFLCLAFLILLAPTSSILPSSDLMFEHRLYLPMIAASILFAWGIISVCGILTKSERIRQAACWGVLGVLLAGYASLSRERTYIWENNIRLWTDAVTKAPAKARAHYNLGVAYLNVDREEARREFLAVTKLSPNHSAALYNLGWIEESLGRFNSAIDCFQASIKADDENWRAHQNLGNLYVLQGQFKNAEMEFEEAIRIYPTYWPAYQSLATLQLQENAPAEALATLHKLKELRPALLEARYLSAYAFVESERFEQAEAELDSIEANDTARAYKQRVEELRHRMESKSGRE